MQISKLKNSNRLLEKILFKCLYIFWSIIKFVLNPRYRSEQISRIRYSKQIIQVSTFTFPNRYPVLFRQIAEALEDYEQPKILSFGCSTGEEVLTLKKIIPNAKITGVDINPWCIKTAIKKNKKSDCNFYHVSNDNWKTKDHYDCILALAVFQKTTNRNPDRIRANNSFGFKAFDRELTLLSKLLKKNGFFILDHSDYRFFDCEIFVREFQLWDTAPVIRSRPTFDRSNNKVLCSSISNRIFRKTL